MEIKQIEKWKKIFFSKTLAKNKENFFREIPAEKLVDIIHGTKRI